LNRYAGCRGNWRSGWAYGIQPDGVDLTLRRLEYLEQRVNDIISIRELNAQA
jgi:hypothetical protein